MEEERGAPAALDPSANAGYLHWPLPGPRDDEIRDLVAALVGAGPGGAGPGGAVAGGSGTAGGVAAGSPAAGLSGEHATVLSAFAERMATLAVRQGATEPLTPGLHAAAVALAAADDRRDVLPVLALLYRAAELTGADPRAAFAGAARDLPPAIADPVLGFAARSHEDRSLDAMGYVERHDPTGFRFDRAW